MLTIFWKSTTIRPSHPSVTIMVCLGFRLEFCDYSLSTAGHGEFTARSSGCLSEFAARSGGCWSEFAAGLHGGCFGC